MNEKKKQAVLHAHRILEQSDNNDAAGILKAAFPKYLEEDKPLNRWYVDDDFPMWFIFYHPNGWYGITGLGNWRVAVGENQERPEDMKGIRLATDEEILERLSNFAKGRGYLDNNFESLKQTRHSGNQIGHFYYGECCLWITKKGKKAYCIMKDGVWAEIIPQTKKLSDVIEEYDFNTIPSGSDVAVYYLDLIKELKEVTEI